MRVALRRTALAAIAGLALGGCRTTHALGPVSDPATAAHLQDVVSRRATYATITPAPGESSKARVVAITPRGVQLDLAAPAVVVPGAQLAYLSTYDRLRGARDGAFILGLPAFAIGAAAGAWIAMNTTGCGCEDDASHPSAFQLGLAVGALSALAGAILGAGAGALVAHEDRYVPATRP